MNTVFPVTCAHLSSCGLSQSCTSWSLPPFHLVHPQLILWVPPALSLLLGAWQASHLGAGRTSQFWFPFYTEMACDLLDLHLFLLLRASRADAIGFLPIFFFLVPSRGHAEQCLWIQAFNCLWTANKRTQAPPTKQVQRSCNSQLWCNSHDCTLPYTLKIIQTIISKYIFHNSKKMHISFGLG